MASICAFVSDDIRMRVLGPVEIAGPHGPVALRGRGHRTLLARLALRPGQPVASSALIDALWDQAPPTAPKTLRSHVAHIRRDLRAADVLNMIVTRDPGYLLRVPPFSVDVVRFESLARRGRQSLSVGDHRAAADQLQAALTLWRGDALDNCRPGQWVRQESARLADARLDAREDLFAAELSLGRHAETVGELSGLVVSHPFRERLWELLMLALYRSGRQAEALAAFRRARSTLVEQLGVEPGTRLRRLESAILAEEPVVHEPPVSVQAVVSGLPAEMTSFIGREQELAKLGGMFAGGRLVTLVGTGGVGKSRLALRSAGQLAASVQGGVRLVELAGLRDRALVPHAVAEALGVRDQSGRSPLAVLVDVLRDQDVLVVLDNCEHLLDACADFVAALLRGCPRLLMLVTSRQPLGVAGEQVLIVSPMPVEHAAMRLFADRARAVVVDFAVTADNVRVVEKLCRRLDGIPLAIELATLVLRTLTPQQILSRLDDRFALLSGARRGVMARHQTMRAAVEWSFELCTPDERLLWSRLSVFAGSFDIEAVEHVCGDSLALVARLVDKSVLSSQTVRGVVRYRLLETLRQFGAEQLVAEESLRRRHLEWCQRLAEWGEREWFGPNQARVFARIHADRLNLRAALEFCLESDPAAGLRLAGTLWFYWIGCGVFAEGRRWLDALLRLPHRGAERNKALWVNGYVATLQGDTAGAVLLLDECRAQIEDRVALAYATFVRGAAAVFDDDLDAGSVFLAEASHSLTELGELNSNVIMTKVALAITDAFAGNLPAAVTLAQEAHAVAEHHGEQWALAYAHYVLAFAACLEGALDQAAAHARQCLTVKQTFNDLLGIAVSVELLALLAALGGDCARAATLLGAVSAIWPRVGVPLFGSRNFAAPHDQCESLARKALGERPYDLAFSSGVKLSIDQAVAMALRA
ncbi:BTAD domain-containing putative transcriptional regulator [Kutzneria sp. CA-103260]|uniref:BTAD domain-containing putative transcriptional regulator n=1 Tax=Kutzneria sp. CA-103260 TaxID=2802641 RepID=UPI001BA9CEC4|nr:BTAD domain-containing putative transcriptional regulator [Kutzneria sp. CA-103260]QUQ63127.1 Bacterial transcriptional activator domain protein [Kutzneria sp. CA-103260]